MRRTRKAASPEAEIAPMRRTRKAASPEAETAPRETDSDSWELLVAEVKGVRRIINEIEVLALSGREL
jgi:hypothetical protein